MSPRVRQCLIACAFVFGGATLAQAQLVYSVVGTNVVTIDPVSGIQVIQGSALAAHLGISAIDLAGHRLFYEATVGSSTVLAIFDLTASTTTQVPLSAPLVFMEFDPVTGHLYGAQGNQVVSINPATGATTLLATSSSPPYLSMGVLDSARRNLHFLATGPALVGTVLRTVSLSTASVVDVALPSNYSFVQMDSATGQLIAASGNSIVSIDPVSGSQSLLAIAPVLVSAYVSAFDPIRRRLFFVGSDTQTYLMTFDVATTSFSQTPFAGGGGTVFLEYALDIAAIPSLQNWALILLAATLVVVAMRRLLSIA